MLLTYDSLDSTNEEAKRLLASGKITGLTAITASRQTAGKGTRGRVWVSPPGCGLYLSIVHPMQVPCHAAPLTPVFTLAAGVACAETLAELTGLSFQLKPINDIYLAGGKLGGILTESIVRDNCLRAVITGIGINLRPDDGVSAHAECTGNRAVSLAEHWPIPLPAGPQCDTIASELAETLTLAVDGWYGRILNGEAHAVLDAYMRYKMNGHELPEHVLNGGLP